MSFDRLFKFEQDLAKYTGAPYVVATDGCTHALELCFRYDRPLFLAFTAYTYLSIPMLMHQLEINYVYTSEEWTGEYQFHGTRIWDSARRLEPGMYRPGQMQCLSFGYSKPMEVGKMGAILLDDEQAYGEISCWRSDGRDLRVVPWHSVRIYGSGWHYCPTLEDCAQALEKLPFVDQEPKYQEYPDLRTIDFKFT